MLFLYRPANDNMAAGEVSAACVPPDVWEHLTPQIEYLESIGETPVRIMRSREGHYMVWGPAITFETLFQS